jgi:hypothetical protein
MGSNHIQKVSSANIITAQTIADEKKAVKSENTCDMWRELRLRGVHVQHV